MRRYRQAWLLAGVVAVFAAAALAVPDPAIDKLPPSLRVELQERQVRWQRLTPVEQALYGQRQVRWQALTVEARRAQRERWQAWESLPEDQRARVRRAATDFAALPVERQQALRAQFDAIDGRDRHGWLLGPGLGAEYARLQPLLAFVSPDERATLLATLRTMTPTERDDLSTLAQRTSPEARAELRRELLSTAAANRGAWLRQRLDR